MRQPAVRLKAGIEGLKSAALTAAIVGAAILGAALAVQILERAAP